MPVDDARLLLQEGGWGEPGDHGPRVPHHRHPVLPEPVADHRLPSRLVVHSQGDRRAELQVSGARVVARTKDAVAAACERRTRVCFMSCAALLQRMAHHTHSSAQLAIDCTCVLEAAAGRGPGRPQMRSRALLRGMQLPSPAAAAFLAELTPPGPPGVPRVLPHAATDRHAPPDRRVLARRCCGCGLRALAGVASVAEVLAVARPLTHFIVRTSDQRDDGGRTD